MCQLCDTATDTAKPKVAAKGKANPFAALIPKKLQTHEALIQAVYDLALRLPTLTKADRDLLKGIKLTYGAGPDGARGVTYYKLWAGKPTRKGEQATAIPFVAICATGQSDHIQVIGTTLHELGHVIAGWKAAHGPDWRAACARLGLVNVKAAGTEYSPENFSTESGFRAALLKLPKPNDGQPLAPIKGPGIDPLSGLAGILGGLKLKPCGAGIGARGGKSRGKGSGSRLLKYSCGCTIVRASAGADFKAICSKCKQPFKQEGGELPPEGGPQGGPVEPTPTPKKAKQPVEAPSKGNPAKLKGQAAAARSKAVNAPLPVKPDGLAAILQRIDPK